ncbi:Inositol phosphoceramide mannosyltransferase 2 [Chlorella vulgaris]
MLPSSKLLGLLAAAAAVVLLLHSQQLPGWDGKELLAGHQRAQAQPACRLQDGGGAGGAGTFAPPLDYRALFNSSRSLEVLARVETGCSWEHSGQTSDLRIPPVLHFVHLPDAEQLISTASAKGASFHLEWALSCMKMYPRYEHLYWDHSAARTLLERRYPSFLPIFDAFPFDMQRADSIRYFIMHRIGGVYFDADVLCYRPAEDLWAGADVVLQGTQDPEFLASAVLASVPGHPFWMHTVDVLKQRFEQFRDELGHILDLTGPFMLRSALKEFLFGSDGDELNARVAGGTYEGPAPAGANRSSVVRIHPQGSYFTPCAWADQDCHKKVAAMQRFGIVPPHMAGYHLYRGSWWGTAEGNPNSHDDKVGAAASEGS